MEAICRRQGVTRWAECTPDNALQLRRLATDFPEALFLHIVRDGRDVAVSLARQQFIQPFRWHRRTPAVAAAAYWDWVERRVARERVGLEGRILSLRYEDLVSSLSGELARLSRFLGTPLDMERIEAAGIGSVSRPNSSFDSTAFSSPIGRWQTSYGEADLGRVEAVARTGLTRHAMPLASTAGARRDWPGRFAGQLYRWRFGLRLFLRYRTPLGRLSDPGFDRLAESADDEDPTLRPG